MTSALESLKNFHFNGFFLSKVYIIWAKKNRGVTYHETEERYTIWRGIDLSSQNWHKQFDKFWPEHSKVPKIFTLMSCFWAKYILFELKKYKGVMFHDIEEWCKIWRKTYLLLGKWQEEFGKFPPEHSKVSKLELWWDPFVQSRKCMSLKFTKSDVSWQWRMIQKLKRNWLVVLKLTWGTSQILTRALKSLKTLCFNWLLVTKVYIAWATKVQKSYLSWHWKIMQILKKN